MKLDKRMVSNLLSLNDEQLGEVIKGIASEAGIPPSSLGLNPASIQSIRQALRMANDEDLKQIGDVYDAYRKNPKQR